MGVPHIPTDSMRKRISDLSVAGIPLHLIAKVVKLDDETVTQHYKSELDCAEPEAIEAVARTVCAQALAGDNKAQALYLKTKGAKFGWVEKHVIEAHDNREVAALHDKIAELEKLNVRDY